MKHRIFNLIMVLGAAFLLTEIVDCGWRSTSSVSAARTSYRVTSASGMRLRKTRARSPLYRYPGRRRIGTARPGQTVQPMRRASAPNQATFYQVNNLRRTLGWINARSLRYSHVFFLPFRYDSQFWPSRAGDACEVAALKMALSVKGKADHVSTRMMTGRIPRSSNPNWGYTGNPFHYGARATIYPSALARVARRYGVRAKNITGASKHQLIYEIQHGNPVVFEGSYKMRNTNSDHSLTLLGYRPGYFFYADPFSRTWGVRHEGWVKTSQFMRIFTARRRGARALLIQ